jgi:hypothetical protein
MRMEQRRGATIRTAAFTMTHAAIALFPEAKDRGRRL